MHAKVSELASRYRFSVDAIYAWLRSGLIPDACILRAGNSIRIDSDPELAGELRRFPVVINEDRIFPPKAGATSGRQRVEGSFEDLLERAGIKDFRFHDLRHTFSSWFMMNGGDLYELAKILGHSNIKMTERYAKLGRQHIARGLAARRGKSGSSWKELPTRRTSVDDVRLLFG